MARYSIVKLKKLAENEECLVLDSFDCSGQEDRSARDKAQIYIVGADFQNGQLVPKEGEKVRVFVRVTKKSGTEEFREVTGIVKTNHKNVDDSMAQTLKTKRFGKGSTNEQVQINVSENEDAKKLLDLVRSALNIAEAQKPSKPSKGVVVVSQPVDEPAERDYGDIASKLVDLTRAADKVSERTSDDDYRKKIDDIMKGLKHDDEEDQVVDGEPKAEEVNPFGDLPYYVSGSSETIYEVTGYMYDTDLGDWVEVKKEDPSKDEENDADAEVDDKNPPKKPVIKKEDGKPVKMTPGNGKDAGYHSLDLSKYFNNTIDRNWVRRRYAEQAMYEEQLKAIEAERVLVAQKEVELAEIQRRIEENAAKEEEIRELAKKPLYESEGRVIDMYGNDRTDELNRLSEERGDLAEKYMVLDLEIKSEKAELNDDEVYCKAVLGIIKLVKQEDVDRKTLADLESKSIKNPSKELTEEIEEIKKQLIIAGGKKNVEGEGTEGRFGEFADVIAKQIALQHKAYRKKASEELDQEFGRTETPAEKAKREEQEKKDAEREAEAKAERERNEAYKEAIRKYLNKQLEIWNDSKKTVAQKEDEIKVAAAEYKRDLKELRRTYGRLTWKQSRENKDVANDFQKEVNERVAEIAEARKASKKNNSKGGKVK